jgi:hypothetical protein
MTTDTRAPQKSTVAIGWVISIFASLLVDTAAVFAAVRIIEFRSHLSLELDDVPVAVPTAPSVSLTPTPTATLADERVPGDCAEVFSRAMVDTLAGEGLELTTVGVASGGTDDGALLELLDGAVVLECEWRETDGGVESGIRSSIVLVDPARQAAAMERVRDLRMTRLDELGGTRYFVEREDAEGRASGESHFFRDGLWFATQWYGHGPYGYTADIARGIFS